MAFIAGNIKNLINIKLKTRHDGYTDQVSRIVVAKVFLVASIVMGVDWFHDNVSCIPPKNQELPHEYISSACWVKGFYIFPRNVPHLQESGYYGIPNDFAMDGSRTTESGEFRFCKTKNNLGQKIKGTCEKMQKFYFVQYQWMPFLIVSMSAMFYFPYMIFRLVNTDVISLKANMKDDLVTCDDIVENYFSHDINPVHKMRVRFFMNFIIKIIYVIVNVSAFVLLDKLLDNQFKKYGTNWIDWSRLNSTYRYDYDMRTLPTPGNQMLPTFGMCDLTDTRMQLTTTYSDKVTVICEVSSNILYQYVFLVLWFVLIISIGIAAIGVIMYFSQHVHVAFFIKNERSSKYVYKLLTFRECEYLEFIRRRDLAMYGIIVNKLRELHSLPLPKLRKMANKERKGATAPMLPNGNGRTKHHHLKHLDSVTEMDSPRS